MNSKIIKLNDLLQQLLVELKNEESNDNSFIINQVTYSLVLINDYLCNLNENKDEKQLFDQLREIYKGINHPRVGLSDYFIWREDFGERVKVNKSLDEIKENLFKLLGK